MEGKVTPILVYQSASQMMWDRPMHKEIDPKAMCAATLEVKSIEYKGAAIMKMTCTCPACAATVIYYADTQRPTANDDDR